MTSATVKKTAANIALLLVVSLAALLLAEFAVRAFMKDEMVLFARYHTDADYGEFTLRRIRPNSVFHHTSVDGSWKFETNAQGFRNREDFSYTKPPGVVRVLTLGDSHTQGYEARQDYTYSASIERYLEARGYKAQVLNTGVSGFSTAEALAFLENEGIKYEPDVVVLGFYANDFEDNIKAGLFGLNEEGELTVVKTRHVPGVRIQNVIYSLPLVPWLSEHSYLYSALFNGVWDFFKGRLRDTALSEATEYAIPMAEKASDYQTELASALLTRMYQFCRDRGIPLVILDIPRISGAASIQHPLKERAADFSDAFIDGSAVLADYAGVAELHAPHGARHISEFAHIMLGVAAARQIDAWLADPVLVAPHSGL
jgi:lysophospholipase L1-like esterase